MPHKTKKEKIIAEYRRRLQLLQKSQPTISKESASIASPQPFIEKKQKIVETEEDSLISSYFKKDFKKSLLLIAIIITLEISLYFATINNNLKLGR